MRYALVGKRAWVNFEGDIERRLGAQNFGRNGRRYQARCTDVDQMAVDVKLIALRPNIDRMKDQKIASGAHRLWKRNVGPVINQLPGLIAEQRELVRRQLHGFSKPLLRIGGKQMAVEFAAR